MLPGFDWPPRDTRAFIALTASIAGAGVLTGFAAWLVYILWLGGWSPDTAVQRLDALARALFGLLAIIGIVLMSLGLAINRRSVKASGLGFSLDATGGDDAPTVTTTTKTEVAP